MITTLSQLIAQTESAGKISALRFEPKFKPSQTNVLKCAGFNKVSVQTAEVICASSWGLYQLMGENLYSFGYQGTILDFWKNPDLQLDYFNLHNKLRYIDFTLDEVITDPVKRTKFATRYNGSAMYADRMLSIYNQLKDKQP